MAMTQEEKRAYNRAYHAAHREELCAKMREYSRTHQEERKVRMKAYYALHQDERIAYSRAYQAAHTDEERERARAYVAANRERVRERRKAYSQTHKKEAKDRQYLKRYGLSLDAAQALLKSQGGRCAICRTDKFNGDGPVVDHDHVTGKVRGILCNNCNSTLGWSRESVFTLKAAIEYLRRANTQTEDDHACAGN